MRHLLLPALVLLASCTFGKALANLENESPPPELGRPGYVRGFAKVGAVTGGVIGAVVSVVLLPITWPISMLAEEPLGQSKEDFMFAPTTGGAAVGHFLFGAPADGLDYVFRRAWMEHPRVYDYEFTPMKPPLGTPGERPGDRVEPADSQPASQPATRR